ncbi:uncharacterized protein LOC113660623 isoform X1, partial [Tachysurus ichikawai]
HRVSIMVLGNTMNAHELFMDKLKSKVKLHEESSKEQSDVIIAFLPIVSRTGTDIQAALARIPRGLPHQRIILVSLHHTFDPGYIAPDSRHSVNRSDVFAVDCLFYEDQGLLNSQCNDKALNRVTKHLGGETSTDNVSVMSWLSVTHRVSIMVLGNTMNAHKLFMDKLKSKVKLHEESSKEQSNVIIAFLPIVSRAGTDIQAALDRIPSK